MNSSVIEGPEASRYLQHAGDFGSIVARETNPSLTLASSQHSPTNFLAKSATCEELPRAEAYAIPAVATTGSVKETRDRKNTDDHGSSHSHTFSSASRSISRRGGPRGKKLTSRNCCGGVISREERESDDDFESSPSHHRRTQTTTSFRSSSAVTPRRIYSSIRSLSAATSSRKRFAQEKPITLSRSASLSSSTRSAARQRSIVPKPLKRRDCGGCGNYCDTLPIGQEQINSSLSSRRAPRADLANDMDSASYYYLRDSLLLQRPPPSFPPPERKKERQATSTMDVGNLANSPTAEEFRPTPADPIIFCRDGGGGGLDPGRNLQEHPQQSSGPLHQTQQVEQWSSPERPIHPGPVGLPPDQASIPYPSYGVPTDQASIPYPSYGVPTGQASIPYAPYGVPTHQASIPYAPYGVPTDQAPIPYALYGVPTDQSSIPYASYGVPTDQAPIPYSSYGIPTDQASIPYAAYGVPTEQGQIPYASYGVPTDQGPIPYTSYGAPTDQAPIPYGAPTDPSSIPYSPYLPPPAPHFSRYCPSPIDNSGNPQMMPPGYCGPFQIAPISTSSRNEATCNPMGIIPTLPANNYVNATPVHLAETKPRGAVDSPVGNPRKPINGDRVDPDPSSQVVPPVQTLEKKKARGREFVPRRSREAVVQLSDQLSPFEVLATDHVDVSSVSASQAEESLAQLQSASKESCFDTGSTTRKGHARPMSAGNAVVAFDQSQAVTNLCLPPPNGNATNENSLLNRLKELHTENQEKARRAVTRTASKPTGSPSQGSIALENRNLLTHPEKEVALHERQELQAGPAPKIDFSSVPADAIVTQQKAVPTLITRSHESIDFASKRLLSTHQNVRHPQRSASQPPVVLDEFISEPFSMRGPPSSGIVSSIQGDPYVIDTKTVESIITLEQTSSLRDFFGSDNVGCDEKGEYLIREVRVPVHEERRIVQHTKETQERVVEKKVPVIQYVEVDVDVPQIEYVDKIVEVEKIEFKTVEKKVQQIVDRPVEVIVHKPVVKIVEREEIRHIPEIIEIPKAFIQERKVVVPRYVDRPEPVVVAQSFWPRIVETNSGDDFCYVDVDCRVINLIPTPYTVHVPVPVPRPILFQKISVSHKQLPMEVIPDEQFNSLFKNLNPDLAFEDALDYFRFLSTERGKTYRGEWVATELGALPLMSGSDIGWKETETPMIEDFSIRTALFEKPSERQALAFEAKWQPDGRPNLCHQQFSSGNEYENNQPMAAMRSHSTWGPNASYSTDVGSTHAGTICRSTYSRTHSSASQWIGAGRNGNSLEHNRESIGEVVPTSIDSAAKQGTGAGDIVSVAESGSTEAIKTAMRQSCLQYVPPIAQTSMVGVKAPSLENFGPYSTEGGAQTMWKKFEVPKNLRTWENQGKACPSKQVLNRSEDREEENRQQIRIESVGLHQRTPLKCMRSQSSRNSEGDVVSNHTTDDREVAPESRSNGIESVDPCETVTSALEPLRPLWEESDLKSDRFQRLRSKEDVRNVNDQKVDPHSQGKGRDVNGQNGNPEESSSAVWNITRKSGRNRHSQITTIKPYFAKLLTKGQAS